MKLAGKAAIVTGGAKGIGFGIARRFVAEGARVVIADVDGIVVVPQAVEAEAINAAWQKVHAENTVREAIAGGMTAAEAFNRFGVL